jgi:hypothetical protein
MINALILVEPEGIESIERSLKLIEKLGGKMVLSFPPLAVIASLPEKKINDLRGSHGIKSLHTQPIPEQTLLQGTPDVRTIGAAWNSYLQGSSTVRNASSKGLSWDAEGRLPPDPPRDIRELLSRREKEMHDDLEKPGP